MVMASCTCSQALTARRARASGETTTPPGARTRKSPLSNAPAVPACARKNRAKSARTGWPSARSHGHSAAARVQRMGSTCLGRTSELDPSSTMNSRRMVTNADKPPARPRRHEARWAAASKLVHSGRNLPTSRRGNAISCTHRRRHEHISSKKRDKAGDDGGNSGGIGCDEVSSMGGGGKVLGEATRSSCTPHRQICRRRARRRGRQRRG